MVSFRLGLRLIIWLIGWGHDCLVSRTTLEGIIARLRSMLFSAESSLLGIEDLLLRILILELLEILLVEVTIPLHLLAIELLPLLISGCWLLVFFGSLFFNGLWGLVEILRGLILVLHLRSILLSCRLAYWLSWLLDRV